MTRRKRLTAACLVAAVALVASCGGGSGGGGSVVNPDQLTVQPGNVTVTMGANVTFTAALEHTDISHGTLTWMVTPATATITTTGTFTAGNTPGTYTVSAVWTSAKSPGTKYSATSLVQVLPTPQSEAVISHEVVQASGTHQENGAVQNAPVLGEPLPATEVQDATGRNVVRHGFTPPVGCGDSRNQTKAEQCL